MMSFLHVIKAMIINQGISVTFSHHNFLAIVLGFCKLLLICMVINGKIKKTLR